MTVNPKFQNNEIKKGLYIIPTPIGNLGDITYRAIEILKKSDFILCEDTRISRKLMEKFEFKSKLFSISYTFKKSLFGCSKDSLTIFKKETASFPSIIL